MWRNFSFPCMTIVGKLTISPYVVKFLEIIRNFGKFWEILPQFTRFHVEKHWPKSTFVEKKGSILSQDTFVPSCFISVGIFWILAQNFFSKVMIYLRKDPPLPNLDLQPASTTELVMHLQSAWNAPVMRLQSTLSSPGVSKQQTFYCLVNCFSILVSLPRSATVILGHCCFSYPSRIFE